MDKNPELIQDGNWMGDDARNMPVPVFLIHDGGGTTFAYHCLDSLCRPTYGIFNPHFRNGQTFEGGVSGMARLYTGIIRRTCARPDFPAERNLDRSVNILIGGWSMGGLLSLEIAKLLTGDGRVKVIGVLMMDSMYTVDPPSLPLDALDNLDPGKSKNMFLSIQAMKEAIRIIRQWDPPVWTGTQRDQRPRVSLLRALDPIPTVTGRVHVADIYRDNETLGWDNYEKGLFTEVMDVQGDHFGMFSFQHIPEISKAIRRCLETLEVLGHVAH
ncbi:hypothetical protein MHUMG1_08808 [Metarhizium humberi]|uniref:Thioesterase domain-containing protein n=1 Tax=Metarhizium humberi TaxID=2596975 RepID=A0A9P8M4I3_9HYPO|nr:hypothetical protein MHUMG1_08808 [Metarhizium humberi]